MFKKWMFIRSWIELLIVLVITVTFYLFSVLNHIFLNMASFVVVRDTHGLEELLSVPIGLSFSLMILAYLRNKELNQLNKELGSMVISDELTGLWNRRGFLLNAGKQLEIAGDLETSAMVIFLDLDRFKIINDSLGHSAGDLLLQQVALRLKTLSQSGGIVARLSGDEFIVLFPMNHVYGQEAADKPEHILRLMTPPFNLNGQDVFITCSVGVSTYPSDGEELEILIKHADTAMYRAKSKGKNNYQFFTSSMSEIVSKRLVLETSLYKALERQEFMLHYQPQLNTMTREIVGVEALIRWNHPQFGVVPPNEFIPLAEETGLILSIGEWALRSACKQNKQWQDAGLTPIRVSVNLSARQFHQPSLVQIIKQVLLDTKLDAQYLDLEISESMLIQDMNEIINKLNVLKGLGLFISIDDFGTGYSSLAYLNKMPIDTLKIDRSFIQGIGEDSNSALISKAIITLAQSLNMLTVAEGIETKAQLDCMTQYQCDMIQGYLISRPIPPIEIESLLQNWKAEGENP